MRPQSFSLRTGLVLLALLAISTLLAWSLPRAAAARSLFQSPVATKTSTAAPPTKTPDAAGAPPSGQAPGYLPAPTVSAPGYDVDGRTIPLLPGSQPPLVAPIVVPVSRTPTPTGNAGAAGVLGVAQLIDNAVLAVSYVWLCCGVLVLVGATLASVWLIRRSQHRTPGGS